MQIRSIRTPAALAAAIIFSALLLACGGQKSTAELQEVLRIPVSVAERLGTWEGTLEPGRYDIWLHYRGSYSEQAKVCFMLKASGEGQKEQELKGWMADVIRQKAGRFLPAEADRSDGFERPLDKTLEVRSSSPVKLEAMIFLGPGAQVRMEEVELILKGEVTGG